MSILANCIAMAVSQGWDIRAEMAGLSVVFLAIQTLHLFQQGHFLDLGRAWLTTANQAYLVNVLVLPEPPAKRRRRRRVRGPASTDQRVRQSARVAGEQAPPVPVAVRPSDLVVRCRCGPANFTCPSCPAHPDVVKVGGPGNWHVAE